MAIIGNFYPETIADIGPYDPYTWNLLPDYQWGLSTRSCQMINAKLGSVDNWLFNYSLTHPTAEFNYGMMLLWQLSQAIATGLWQLARVYYQDIPATINADFTEMQQRQDDIEYDMILLTLAVDVLLPLPDIGPAVLELPGETFDPWEDVVHKVLSETAGGLPEEES